MMIIMTETEIAQEEKMQDTSKAQAKETPDQPKAEAKQEQKAEEKPKQEEEASEKKTEKPTAKKPLKNNDNPMRKLRISKVTLNFGAGKNQQLLEKGVKLLKKVSGVDPVTTVTQKRIPNWDLRPGLAIGAKITLRGKKAEDVMRQALTAKEDGLTEKNFDNYGNVSFGVPEYIEIEGVKYDPEIGILGFEISATIERPGFRISKRRLRAHKVPQKHRVTKEESISFIKEKFGVNVE